MNKNTQTKSSKGGCKMTGGMKGSKGTKYTGVMKKGGKKG